MAKVICIANQKGGCGKTTSAVNLAHALALSEKDGEGKILKKGKRVLLIDADPQHSASKIMGERDFINKYRTLVNFFTEENATLESCILPSKYENIDFICSHIDMFAVKLSLENDPINHMQFRNKLTQELKQKYDFIIIDCPPDLGGLLIINALSVADYYIVPIGAEDSESLDGMDKLTSQIKRIQKNLNPGLKFLKALITMRDNRSNISKAMVHAIPSAFGQDKVFKTIIRRNAALPAATAKNKTIFAHDVNQPGAHDYQELAAEILEFLDNEG